MLDEQSEQPLKPSSVLASLTTIPSTQQSPCTLGPNRQPPCRHCRSRSSGLTAVTTLHDLICASEQLLFRMY
jgi:hypothetical protein